MKTIQVKLDPKSIADAIKELEAYKKEVETKARLLVQRLTDLGAEIVRIKIVAMGAVYSGELLSGASGYFSPSLNAGFVRVTSDHVAFVEFGTGVVGQANPDTKGEYLAKAAWQVGFILPMMADIGLQRVFKVDPSCMKPHFNYSVSFHV